MDSKYCNKCVVTSFVISKEILSSDGQQFHQSKRTISSPLSPSLSSHLHSPLTFTHRTQERPRNVTLDRHKKVPGLNR